MKTEVIRFRVTETRKAQIEGAAESAGQTVARWLDIAIDEALGGERASKAQARTLYGGTTMYDPPHALPTGELVQGNVMLPQQGQEVKTFFKPDKPAKRGR